MANPALLMKAAAVFTNDETRKKAGWVLAAVLSPLILILALFCSLACGAAQHNDAAVDLVFSGGALPNSLPEEYALHIQAMQECLDVLDSVILDVNNQMESGTLDSALVKSAFYAPYFGRDSPPAPAGRRPRLCGLLRALRNTDKH